MKNLLLKTINMLILVISSTLFVYFLKLHADTNSIKHLVLLFIFVVLMLFEFHIAFKDKSISYSLIVIAGKVLPIFLLFLIDLIVLKNKITFYKIIGFVLLTMGILFLLF
jgi:multidrug transporter EmrE-like cation transporter